MKVCTKCLKWNKNLMKQNFQLFGSPYRIPKLLKCTYQYLGGKLSVVHWPISRCGDGQLVGGCHTNSRYMIHIFQHLWEITDIALSFGAGQISKMLRFRTSPQIPLHIEHPCHSIFLLKLFVQGVVDTITNHKINLL